jgi:hypothetical protein
MHSLRRFTAPLALWCILVSASAALALCPDDDPADGICDVNLLRARVRKTFNSVRVNGQFITDPDSGDIFDATAPIMVHVEDFFQNLDHTTSWLPSECSTTARRIRCRRTDGTATALFASVGLTPNVIRFRVRAKGLNLPLEAQIGISVTATFTHNAGTVRQGSVEECKVGPRGLRCRKL